MDKIELEGSPIFDAVTEKTEKVESFQKKYNVISKNFAYIVGKNLTLFICMLVPLLLIGFVWTDFGAIVISTKMISDGVLTVALFAIGEIMMTRLGADGGKLDSEYLSAKKEYDDLSRNVGEIGTMLIGVFCDWQIELELARAIQYRLRMIRMPMKDYETVKDLTVSELEEKYGKKKAAKIVEINSLEPIELNEDVLLYNGEGRVRGGVPVSADAYLRNKKHLVETVIACLFTGLLTVSVVISLTTDVSFARVVYTAFKLVMLLFRMARGYDRGSRAYNTIEVRQLKAKSNYLRQYIKFVEDKIYLNLKDKLDEISCIVSINEEKAV